MKSLWKSWGLGLSSEWRAAIIHEKTSYQWALLEETSKGLTLSSFGIDETGNAMKELLERKGKDRVFISSALPSLPLLAKHLSLPVLKEEELLPAISDLLEKNLNTSMEGYEITFESFPSKEGELFVMTYLIPKETLQDELISLQKTIDPEWLFAKPSCLAAFLRYFKALDWNFILDIGEDEVTCALVWQGRIIQSSALVGSASSFANIEDENFTGKQEITTLLQHIKETLLSYKTRYNLKETIPVTVTGRVVLSPLAPLVIAEFLECPLSPLHEASCPNEEGLPFLSCALAIGASFMGHPSTKNELLANFRTKNFAFKNPLSHVMKPLISLAIGSLAITAALFWWGLIHQQEKETALFEEWQAITTTCKTTPEAIESRYTKEKGTPYSLVDQAQFLLDSIKKKAVFPLQPVVPNVSTIISWISQQIDSVSKDSSSKIEIQQVHYVMTKHPEKNLPKERYLIRVDIEFTTPSQTIARAFHDLLLSPNTYIDPKLEVKWVANGSKYMTSFFLKDKTFYPPQGS